jgi:hypothetical protein
VFYFSVLVFNIGDQRVSFHPSSPVAGRPGARPLVRAPQTPASSTSANYHGPNSTRLDCTLHIRRTVPGEPEPRTTAPRPRSHSRCLSRLPTEDCPDRLDSRLFSSLPPPLPTSTSRSTPPPVASPASASLLPPQAASRGKAWERTSASGLKWPAGRGSARRARSRSHTHHPPPTTTVPPQPPPPAPSLAIKLSTIVHCRRRACYL